MRARRRNGDGGSVVTAAEEREDASTAATVAPGGRDIACDACDFFFIYFSFSSSTFLRIHIPPPPPCFLSSCIIISLLLRICTQTRNHPCRSLSLLPCMTHTRGGDGERGRLVKFSVGRRKSSHRATEGWKKITGSAINSPAAVYRQSLAPSYSPLLMQTRRVRSACAPVDRRRQDARGLDAVTAANAVWNLRCRGGDERSVSNRRRGRAYASILYTSRNGRRTSCPKIKSNE